MVQDRMRKQTEEVQKKLTSMGRLTIAVYILWIVLFSSKSWVKRTDVFIEWEIVKDFFWNLNLYDQFDSESPTDNAAKNDWRVVLSFGWTF